jgi:RNA polymerase sigma-70 factor, ECF subfamily
MLSGILYENDTVGPQSFKIVHFITIFYQTLWKAESWNYVLRVGAWLPVTTTAPGSTTMSEFHRLVENEIPRLRRYARALTRDSIRADDLVQDTLVRGIAKAHLWQAGSDIRAWLFTIMHNQYVNNIRHAMREEATVDVDQVASTLVATSDPTAARELSELDHALGYLSKGQREVVLLVGLEGMSYDEAAKILRVPIGTIRSRLGRAREALRLLMGIDEGTECGRRVAAEPDPQGGLAA